METLEASLINLGPISIVSKLKFQPLEKSKDLKNINGEQTK